MGALRSRRALGIPHFVQTRWLSEALELCVGVIAELDAFARYQLPNDVRHHYLARLRVIADATGHLHSSPEDVAIFRNWFSRVQANTDAEHGVRVLLIAQDYGLLDRGGAADGTRGRLKSAMIPSPVCLISAPP
jgi:hypothetical protein